MQKPTAYAQPTRSDDALSLHPPLAQMTQKDWDFTRKSLAEARRRYYAKWPAEPQYDRNKMEINAKRESQARYRKTKREQRDAASALLGLVKFEPNHTK